MGLNAKMLLYSAGRVRCSTSQPPQFSDGGTPVTALGLLSLVLGAPQNVQGRVPYAANGGVAADIGGAVAVYCNGLPFTAADRLACDQVGAIATATGGLPLTASGAVAIAAPE